MCVCVCVFGLWPCPRLIAPLPPCPLPSVPSRVQAGVAAVAKWFGSKLASETWAENEERRVVAGWDWKDEVYAGHSAICIGGDVPEELYVMVKKSSRR